MRIENSANLPLTGCEPIRNRTGITTVITSKNGGNTDGEATEAADKDSYAILLRVTMPRLRSEPVRALSCGTPSAFGIKSVPTKSGRQYLFAERFQPLVVGPVDLHHLARHGEDHPFSDIGSAIREAL